MDHVPQVRLLTAVVPTAARRVVVTLLAVLATLLPAYLVCLHPPVRDALAGSLELARLDALAQALLYVVPAALVGVRALFVRVDRTAWAVLAVGLASYAAGRVHHLAVVTELDAVPPPALADGLRLLLYPAAYVCAVLLLRRRIVRFHHSMWLDGVVVVLCTAAFATLVLLGPLTAVSGDKHLLIALNLGPPLGALLLLLVFALGVSLRQARPSAGWCAMGLALLVLAVGDVAHLVQASAGSYVPGTWLDGTWPAALAVVGASAWVRPANGPRVPLSQTLVIAIPLFSATFAVLLVLSASVVPDDGSRLPVWLAVATILVALVRSAFTLTEFRVLSDAHRQARTDDLTGLSNRRHFLEVLETCLLRSPQPQVAVLHLDLDRFKEVNDSFGHSVGDSLLEKVSLRLRGALRPEDLLARLGGDEFAVVLVDVDREDAIAVAERIADALCDPFALDTMSVHVDVSIGVALCPEHADDALGLLQRADSAMYVAKALRAGVSVFEPESGGGARSRLQTLEELRAALENDQLELYYQPKVELSTDTVVGVEALVRWQHPTRGLLYPDAFLPLAEKAGLMQPLSLCVLGRALRDVSAWRADGHDLSVAVNLSVSNLQDPGLPHQVGLLLDANGVPARALELEITEDILMADADKAQSVLAGLRALGVGLSVDDYGTGYSSLAYLRALPVDELKLDRSFVTNMDTDARAAAIVESTISMAHRLGMVMVAEGVETQDVADRLRLWGCDLAQGYYLSRPVPAERLLAWLEHRVAAGVVRQPVGR